MGRGEKVGGEHTRIRAHVHLLILMLAYPLQFQIPEYLKIDTEEPLLGSMKPYKRHLLFQTPGKQWNNWPPKLEEQEGSLATEVGGRTTHAYNRDRRALCSDRDRGSFKAHKMQLLA